MATLDPEQQRQFAVEVIRTLRAAGHRAYWAGGCVRDRLLGRVPKDYDVATDATPERIRQVFGRRRTVAVGAAFGVITVVGPPAAGLVEVATFRRDAAYSDGRHPDYVEFSDPEEDAARRDFTVNGLFYDPIDEQVLDFVGGRADLAQRVIRAIGDPFARFGEDKLRMLRAVRFAETYAFAIDPDTWAALRQMAAEILVVSPERIAEEMRRVLVHGQRARGVRLLIESGLAAAILPEVVPADEQQQQQLDDSLSVLDRLESPGFALALAALLGPRVDADSAELICRRWRLSNHETSRVCWLVEHRTALRGARAMRWSRLQRLLIAAGIHDLVSMHHAAARAGFGDTEEVAWCRELLQQPAEQLNPQPLVTGDDLLRHGVPSGPKYRELLERVRDAQLDGEVHTQAEALALVDQWSATSGAAPSDDRTRHGKTGSPTMDKKAKKKIDSLQQRIQRLRQQVAGAKRQADESNEAASLQRELADAETELARLKAES